MTEETEIKTEPIAAPPPEDPAAALQTELADMKEKYLRALADGENARRRIAKEKQDLLSFGIENAIAEFLPAIDHLETALSLAENSSDEVKNWAKGFEMILAQFKQVLQNYGIASFKSEGCPFDPSRHDAIETAETTEFAEGTILKEFTKGYQSAVRTIRPAHVLVARAPRKPEPAPPAETVQTEK